MQGCVLGGGPRLITVGLTIGLRLGLIGTDFAYEARAFGVIREAQRAQRARIGGEALKGGGDLRLGCALLPDLTPFPIALQ